MRQVKLEQVTPGSEVTLSVALPSLIDAPCGGTLSYTGMPTSYASSQEVAPILTLSFLPRGRRTASFISGILTTPDEDVIGAAPSVTTVLPP